jgi:hypothetical protein
MRFDVAVVYGDHNDSACPCSRSVSKSVVTASVTMHRQATAQAFSSKKSQFRLHLLDRCKLLGKTLVLCSEMYTSRTCARCCRLYVNLPSSADVFQCPHCEFWADHDENAAFNVMRFVWASSLSVLELNVERQSSVSDYGELPGPSMKKQS